jgi:hypothetical protein
VLHSVAICDVAPCEKLAIVPVPKVGYHSTKGNIFTKNMEHYRFFRTTAIKSTENKIHGQQHIKKNYALINSFSHLHRKRIELV